MMKKSLPSFMGITKELKLSTLQCSAISQRLTSNLQKSDARFDLITTQLIDSLECSTPGSN